jgi:hypothetical protein
MFGTAQLEWLLASLDPHKVNLLVNETSWLADPDSNVPRDKRDKPWYYRYEQQLIADYITSGGYRVAWIGGDRHYVGYLAGSGHPHNSLGGFPCYISSGTSQHSLALRPGERMTWQYGADFHPSRPVCGYMQLTVKYDDTSGAVTLSGLGRAVLDTSQPKSLWTMSDIPGGVATDRWSI